MKAEVGGDVFTEQWHAQSDADLQHQDLNALPSESCQL